MAIKSRIEHVNAERITPSSIGERGGNAGDDLKPRKLIFSNHVHQQPCSSTTMFFDNHVATLSPCDEHRRCPRRFP